MRLIVAGTRTFNDYDLLRSSLDHFLSNITEEIIIVSGKARGADTLGERYAKEKRYEVKEFPADWSKGKSAGYLRNEEMAKWSTHSVIFWDGKSPGSKMMVDLSVKYGLKVKVVIIK